MKLRSKMLGLAAGGALAAAVSTGLGVVQVADAAQAAPLCGSTAVYAYSGYNATCKSARHFNITKSGSRLTTNLAPFVSKGKTSSQPVCQTNVTSYGMSKV